MSIHVPIIPNPADQLPQHTSFPINQSTLCSSGLVCRLLLNRLGWRLRPNSLGGVLLLIRLIFAFLLGYVLQRNAIIIGTLIRRSHSLYYRVFAALDQPAHMSRLDAHKAEYANGDEFGDGAHEVFEGF